MPSVGRDVRPREPLCTADGKANWCRSSAEDSGGNSQLGLGLLLDPANPPLGTYPEGILTVY